MVTKAASVQAVMDVDERLLAVVAMLRGEFTSEIAEMKEKRAALEEKLGMVATVEQAAKIKADADAYAAKTKDAADSILAKASAQLATANATQAAADAAAKSAADRESQAKGIMAEYAQKERELAVKENSVANREGALLGKSNELDDREAKIAEKAKNLQAKIDAVSGLTV